MIEANAVFAESEKKGSLSDLLEFNRDWNLLGNPDYHVNDDKLAYSINGLIREFDPYNKGIISQTRFYKLLYLLSYNLENEGIDIKLPYFWYRYGPVVPIHFLPKDIIEIRPTNWGKHSGKAVLLRNRIAFNSLRSDKDSIDNAIKMLWEKYHGSKTDKIVLDAYATAPYEFQRRYKDFYKFISYKVNYRQIIGLVQKLKENEDIIRLENAVESFDESEFAEAYDDLLQWRLITKYSIQELGTIDSVFMMGLSSIYWDRLFCKFLQTKKYNNLPSRLVRTWQRSLPNSSKEFKKEFKILEYKFYSKVYKPTDGLSKNTRNAYCECISSLFK